MEEIRLKQIMNERNLSVIGSSLTAEEKTANMIKALYIVIPPKSISDRTTLRNIVKHFSEAAKSNGEQPDRIFKIIINFAIEASGPYSRVPAAVFMSILKKELGYLKKPNNTDPVTIDIREVQYIECCDCGLVHEVEYEIYEDGKILMTFTRNEERTELARLGIKMKKKTMCELLDESILKDIGKLAC